MNELLGERRECCNNNDSLLFFFLLLVIIFCNCGMFGGFFGGRCD